MELTNYLKNKLVKLSDSFTHKGEEFNMISYGGDGNRSYVYWQGDKGTTIEMKYSMNKIGEDHYEGVRNISKVEIH